MIKNQPFGFVYITTNSANGKKYIGQCSLEKRNWVTYLGSGKALRAAIRKYGRSCFSREILCYGFSRADLNFLEEHIIEMYDAIRDKTFYNISPRAHLTKGFKGKKHTTQAIEKIRNYGKKRPATQRMRDNMRSVALGHTKTEKQLAASRKNAVVAAQSRKRPKEERTYSCPMCHELFSRTEYVHHPRRDGICCSKQCTCRRVGLNNLKVSQGKI